MNHDELKKASPMAARPKLRPRPAPSQPRGNGRTLCAALAVASAVTRATVWTVPRGRRPRAIQHRRAATVALTSHTHTHICTFSICWPHSVLRQACCDVRGTATHGAPPPAHTHTHTPTQPPPQTPTKTTKKKPSSRSTLMRPRKSSPCLSGQNVI